MTELKHDHKRPLLPQGIEYLQQQLCKTCGKDIYVDDLQVGGVVVRTPCEDPIHCDWCEFLGLNAIHPLSWITEHEGRNGTCKYMTRYRNNLRTPAELKKAASSRYFETVLRLFREKHLNEAILLKDELDIRCYEQHGEECFRCGSTEKLQLDHILPLNNFYANTLNNMILC